MSSNTVIEVEHLSKRYRVGHREVERYHSLRDNIVRSARNLVRTTGDMLRGRQIVDGDAIEDFWALRDVSFKVNKGDTLGIVGRNGAGKSTLLKILSRITEPTTGRVRIKGRVASLLEVGTGFHPELTGRENIFLNGAILGMSRREIKSRFDEIVSFAEIEKFLDTPVKRYSSGMYVRLAFAVAAHLEPETLIVDEVLAVGDVAFQRKCLGKMRDVSHHEGRTVLFVSHNVAAVRNLCKKGLYLDNGELVVAGDIEEAVAGYLSGQASTGADGVIPDDLPRDYSTGQARLRAVHLMDSSGGPLQALVTGQPLAILVRFEVLAEQLEGLIELGITTIDGVQVTQSFSTDPGQQPLRFTRGVHELRLVIEDRIFPGRYCILAGVHLANGTTVDFVERSFDFEVINAPEGTPFHYPWSVRGYMRPVHKWSGR